MATQIAAIDFSPATPEERPVDVRYVARQPILDLRGNVHGYELLFRSGRENAFRGDCDMATRTMLDNTVMFGLERLTGGLTAFVNCTQEALTSNLVDILPPSQCVLEILETVEPTPEVIEACRNLKKAGFRLALDDFIWHPKYEPLIELADYIKVDFTLSNANQRRELFKRLSGRPIIMLAEKIETQEEYKQACAEGFTLIQGYYFCRPQLIENRKVPANRLSQIEILRMLREESLDLPELARLVKQDTSLTYRLLRLINSPAFAIRQQVRSVEAALLAIGEDVFRRIATLAITSELNGDQPVELLRMAFIRGRFCELAAGLYPMDATEQYLLGLLSLLPAMLQVPMQQLIPSLPLRDEICVALKGESVPERRLLEWLTALEHGDWTACDSITAQYGLDQAALLRTYEDAVLWAESALHFA
ncbi:MAG TPA: HDOD domain-containing protein [Terracidiphilus sp.]|jgi:EAL and modified HD-GYP domain-containing signal transduction protein|nr:HDOD domain-containing protein [Terracidiphilus sp.]